MATFEYRKLAPHWALVVLVGVLAIGSGLSSSQLGRSVENEDKVCTNLLDIVIVVDESGSIGPRNFELTRTFLSEFINMLPVSEDDIHIALVTYSTEVVTQWNLEDPRAREKSLGSEAVSKLPYNGGLTFTHLGLERAHELLFSEGGGREEAPKLVLLMTDGESNYENLTLDASKKLRDTGTIIVVLGVGPAVLDEECQQVAGCTTTPCERYIRSGWSTVTSQVKSIMKAACRYLAKDAICSEWSDFGPCEGECGQEGVRKSTRVELTPAKEGTPPCRTCPAPKGRSCADQAPGLVRTERCMMPVCVVDAFCGEFGEWSPWSGTCGMVSRRREREKWNNPPASGGGLSCEEQRPPKQRREEQVVEKSPCPVNQQPGPWGEWSSCSTTCGVGKRTRTRTGIPQEGELYGGQTLIEQGIKVHEEESCNNDPCPVDATCGEWTPFTECSKSCGGGTQEREMRPWLENAQYGGRTCMEQYPGGPKETRECNQHQCPVDEVPGDWGDWGPCSQQCGPGTQKRYRLESVVQAMYGGKSIEEQNRDLPDGQKILMEEVRNCENHPCGPCTLPFTEWSACSSCEGSRIRHTMVVFDYYNGRCDMPTEESESCEGYCSASSDAGSEEPGDGEKEPGDEEKEEGEGMSTATIAGGVVGGLLLLGAAGGGAAYTMGGGSAAAEAVSIGETEVALDESESSLLQGEKEELVSPGEQTEMWAP